MPVFVQSVTAQYAPPPPPRPLPPIGNNTPYAANDDAAAPSPSSPAYGNTTAPVAQNNDANREPLPPKSIAQTESNDGPPPQFKVNGQPRGLSTGYYGALLLGANFAHDDDLSNIGGAISASDSTSTQPFASLKFGYTWAFNQPPVEQFSDVAQSPGLFFSGGLEVEGMYVRSGLSVNSEPNVANNHLTFDTGAIMFNAFLKAQAGKFRFYAGPGFGPAFVGYSSFGSSGGGTSLQLAYQFSAGIDYYITPQWSIFTEYKWFVLDDLKLYGGTSKLDFGNFQQHLIGIGVRRSF